jgi:hypothetical protein
MQTAEPQGSAVLRFLALACSPHAPREEPRSRSERITPIGLAILSRLAASCCLRFGPTPTIAESIEQFAGGEIAMLAELWPWIGAAALALAVAGAVGWWFAQRSPLRPSLERARKLFHLQRERCEHRLFMLASASGKPRGLEWMECDFEDEVSFARDRHTGRLRALVAVTIRFKAIEGGGMEDNLNVDNLKAASAVFLLDGDDWSTDGRVVFNLNPVEAIRHYREELELVE